MYNFEQADRMKNVPLSKIREMVELSTAMEKEGKPIIHLEIGEPDFDTPKHICEAAKEALDAGKVHYGPIVGYEDIRKAVGDEYKKKYGLAFTAFPVPTPSFRLLLWLPFREMILLPLRWWQNMSAEGISSTKPSTRFLAAAARNRTVPSTCS